MHKYKFKTFVASVDIFAKAILKVYNLQKDIENNKNCVSPTLQNTGKNSQYGAEIKNSILIKVKDPASPEKSKKTVSFKPKISVALFDSKSTPAEVSKTSPRNNSFETITKEKKLPFTFFCLALLPGPAKILTPLGFLIDKILE